MLNGFIRPNLASFLFDRHILEFADGSGTKVNVGEGNKLFSYKLKLPEGVTCDQCVIQVRLNLNPYSSRTMKTLNHFAVALPRRK